MARRSSRSMMACTSSACRVQGEQSLDAALILEEHRGDLVHGLDLLEPLLDHRLALVGLQYLRGSELTVIGQTGYMPSERRS
jgi:hypothetical protein